MTKIRTVFEIGIFACGIVFMIGIPLFMRQFGMNMAISFGIGIFEGLLISSFARNVSFFPETFRGWKADFYK